MLDYVCGGNKDALTRLLTIWAMKYQRPSQKLRCIVVFRGTEGAGKSYATDAHAKICGPYLSTTTNLDQVVGRFNGHLQTLLWIVLDEAMFPGDKKAVAALKRFATAKDMAYERKFKDVGAPQLFLTDVMMTTNEDWAIPFSSTDRRYVIYDVKLPPVEERKEYMSKLFQTLENDEVAEFFHLLLNFNIPPGYDINFEIQTSNNNTAKADQALQGFDGALRKFFSDHLAEDDWGLGSVVPLHFYGKRVKKTAFCDAMRSEIYDKPENAKLKDYGKFNVNGVLVDFTGSLTPKRMTMNLKAMIGGAFKAEGDSYVFSSAEAMRTAFATLVLKCPEYFETKESEVSG